METNSNSHVTGNADKEKNITPNPDETRRAGGSSSESGDVLPENDPAVINPDELATFPKEANDDNPDLEEERKSHSVQLKSSPVREGRNITRTGPSTDTGDFM